MEELGKGFARVLSCGSTSPGDDKTLLDRLRGSASKLERRGSAMGLLQKSPRRGTFGAPVEGRTLGRSNTVSGLETSATASTKAKVRPFTHVPLTVVALLARSPPVP